MTPVQSSEAGPAYPAGPATAAPRPVEASTQSRPVETAPVSTADTAASAQPAADHGHGTGEGRGGRRVVLTAAVAGALLAGGLTWALGSGDSAGLKTIQITARYSRFEPDRVTVKPGSTVRFVIHNLDPIDHEFIIGPPETHDIHERGEPHFHTGAVRGEVTVPAGATVETTWTFDLSGRPDPGGPGVTPGQPVRPDLAPGEVAYGCHLAGHWDYGMHGKALLR